VETRHEQEVTIHREIIAQSIQELTDLYEKSAQLWINLHKDGKLHEIEQKEEGINTTLQDLKQK
jgi:plasmid maintenance system antidote protein VapI